MHQSAALRNDEYTDILIGDLNAKITQRDVELLHKARYTDEYVSSELYHKTRDMRGGALMDFLLSEGYQWALNAETSGRHSWHGPRGQRAQLDLCFIQTQRARPSG